MNDCEHLEGALASLAPDGPRTWTASHHLQMRLNHNTPHVQAAFCGLLAKTYGKAA